MIALRVPCRLRRFIAASLLLLLGALPALAATPKPQLGDLFVTHRLKEIDAVIEEAITQKNCPGAVFWLERSGVAYTRTLGRRSIEPRPEPMTPDTVFDAASLTKVVATTPSVMLLLQRGKLSLEAPVSRYLPRFTGEGREQITLRHLLTHTSGLKPGLSRQPAWQGYQTAIDLALRETPNPAPGTAFRYSDINFILLGEIVRQITGDSLDRFAEREIFRPLRMKDTRFLPTAALTRRAAPTEKVEERVLRGIVHDPTSRAMGGVAGHAGLFTTASDLARYCRMLLGGGELEGTRLFSAETVRLMTSVQSPESVDARRGLGWDIDSGYSRPRGRVFPLGSYGHTGFTGTCLWIDPFSKTFWIFLSSRLHPDGKGNILLLQTELGTLSAQAVRDFDFEHVSGALAPRKGATPLRQSATEGGVLNGIDVLIEQNFAPLKGLRVGLITNHTGQDRQRRSTLDLLFKAPGVRLQALFSPEHGIRGVEDAKVSDSKDAATGLPVYSLYGERRSPAAKHLESLDALVFDIQDIGCRYYTYIATLGNCMEAASKAGLKFVVLDRVNPINGLAVEGPVHTNTSTFVAYHPIPLRHGMTLGEIARMLRDERGWKLDLTVIPLKGWKRSMWYDETGLPWTNPSPNMRSLAGATLYPALGFHEAAMSVGRGTDTPFQWVGAPYVNDRVLANELSRAGLPGVRFMPVQFQPTYSTFKSRNCGGVAITVTDRDRFSPVDLGIELARALRRLYPAEFAMEKLRSLLTDAPTMERIVSDTPLKEIKAAWDPELARFRARREKFLLYP